jgi:[NiFe] hydrogenase diaphorase moiety small subunit
MSDIVTLTIDGTVVKAVKGQKILEAAGQAGIYIPHLCAHKKLLPGGHCRVCTVLVNGRPQSACTHPVGEGMTVQNNTAELNNWRKSIIEMLFVDGNHFCMFCEKSGNCELQAMGYRLGMTHPRHQYQFPKHHLDASHPDVMIERNRCILCGRCVRSSRQLDRKAVFGFVGRGHQTRLGVNAQRRLSGTDLQVTDEAVSMCPVGSILRKRVGFAVPVGKRLYDTKPIGSEIEEKRG